MMDSKELVFFIFAQLMTAGGVYAAIRADLRECLVRISILEKRYEIKT